MRNLMLRLFTLIAALTVAFAAFSPVATAEAAPRLVAEKQEVLLHPGETAGVVVTLKNPGSVTFSATDKTSSSNEKVLPLSNVTLSYSGENEATLWFYADTQQGRSTYKAEFELSNGRKYTLTFAVSVYENYAPVLRWNNLQFSDAGYPQLKLAMEDDFGLSNVCFVRNWTDEAGAAQREIYDIISLYGQTDAIIFRTLDKPGEYSIQVNDGTKKRLNTKTLITVLDTDGNGVIDTYFTDDPTITTALNIADGLSPAQTTNSGV